MRDMSNNNNVSRRSFIKGAVGVGILAVTGTALYMGPLSKQVRNGKDKLYEIFDDDAIQFVRQIVTADNGTSRLIMWQSESALDKPELIVRVADAVGDGEKAIYSVTEDFFTDDGKENLQYTVLADKLQPDMEYEFAVVNGSARSNWYTMKTCSKERKSFSMLIFPDSQSSDYSDWEKVVQGALQKKPNAELFVNMGDLVDNGEDSSQWRAWFRAMDGLMGNVAFAPVIGNHECYNQKWKERLPEAYLHYFQVPKNDSQEFNRYYYSFNYGSVHFISLGTVENEVKEFIQGLTDQQVTWLKNDLAQNKQKWTVVMMHRDVLRYAANLKRLADRKEGFEEEGLIFMPIFEQYHVDVVFTAHLHSYRNRGHIKDQRRDASGPLYILTGVAGNVRYDNLWKEHALDVVVAPQPDTNNFITMDISDNQLQINCYLPDGKQIDEVIVQK